MTAPVQRRAPPGGPALPLRRRRRSALVLASALFLLGSGCVYLPHPPLPDPATLSAEEHADQNEQVFDAAWNLVRRGYFSRNYNKVDWDEARARHLPAARAATNDVDLYAAINALLAELQDDHTHALTARESEELFRAERVLLGLVLRPETPAQLVGPMLVFDTIPGSTAAEVGVRPGWVLLSCDGRPPQHVLGIGRLTEHQVVQCVFRDEKGQPRELGLSARRISTHPLLLTRELDDGVVILRFDKFDGASARWLRAQLKAHANAPGVVLDLRQNPGGDAAALGRMLGEFFRSRIDMGRFITRRGLNDRLRAWSWLASARYGGPVAVLVSGNSASSSEIFAAVMQYHQRARIIGEPTAGAVLASRFFPLPGGGRLQLSIDDYIAPDGKRLEDTGVTPDEIVVQSIDDLRQRRDPALDAALAYVRDEAGVRPPR